MRAITVRQPWAWAIIHGGKDVENRTRNIAGAYRGPVAIHTSLHPMRDRLTDLSAAVIEALRERFGTVMAHPWTLMPAGHVIGVVDLVDVHSSSGRLDVEVLMRDTSASGMCSPWAEPTMTHLVLANPRPLPQPIRATGRLGLWTLPTDVEAEVLRQVTP